MTQRFVFVGGRLRGAGFRLAGFTAIVPRAGEEAACLSEALATADLAVVDPAVAERVAPAQMDAWLAAADPPVVILPLPDALSAADPAVRVRSQLGLEP